MATKKTINYEQSLGRLNGLASDRASVTVGPAPAFDLRERLDAADRLEASGVQAPLAHSQLTPNGEGVRAYLSTEPGQYRSWRTGMFVQVGDRFSVATDQIRPNGLNPRAFYFEEDLKDRSISIVNEGQLQAVQVYPPGIDGVFELHDGETRWRSLKLVGRPTVNVEVVEKDPNPLVRFKQARTLNTERRSQSVFDDAVRFKELLAQHLVTENNELVMAFGLSSGYVSKVLSIGELPAYVIERMAHNAEYFGIANAYAMYQYWTAQGRDNENLEKMIAKVIAKRLSVRAVQQLVDTRSQLPRIESQAPPRKRERPLSRAEVRTGAKGELKAFPDGKLQLELSEIPENNRAIIFNRILQVFDECGLRYESVNPPAEPGLASG